MQKERARQSKQAEKRDKRLNKGEDDVDGASGYPSPDPFGAAAFEHPIGQYPEERAAAAAARAEAAAAAAAAIAESDAAASGRTPTGEVVAADTPAES